MRVLVIVNNLSGQGDAGLYDFVRAVGETGAEITLRFFTGEGSIEDLLGDARSYDRVVAAGGDGTVSTIAYALRGARIPILAYPAGTANALAFNLGMPTEHRALAKTLVEGRPIGFDLGEIEYGLPGGPTSRAGFSIMAGAGFDATLMEAAHPLKATLGPAAYLAAAVSNLAPKVSDFEIELDGEMVHTDGIAVLIINFGRIQFDLPLAHGSDPRDGVFEVAVMRGRNLAGLVPAVIAAILDRSGDFPERGSGLDLYSASHVEVSAYPPLRMQYDGDAIDALTPFAAHVLPLAATFLVPPGSPFE